MGRRGLCTGLSLSLDLLSEHPGLSVEGTIYLLSHGWARSELTMTAGTMVPCPLKGKP